MKEIVRSFTVNTKLVLTCPGDLSCPMPNWRLLVSPITNYVEKTLYTNDLLLAFETKPAEKSELGLADGNARPLSVCPQAVDDRNGQSPTILLTNDIYQVAARSSQSANHLVFSLSIARNSIASSVTFS